MLATAGLGAAALAGCGSGSGAAQPARSFLTDWSSGRWSAAARLTDGRPQAVAAALAAYAGGLDVSRFHTALGPVITNGSTARADYTATLPLAGLATWRYRGTLALRQKGSAWVVAWRPSDLYPKLRNGQRLELVRALPPRAALLDGNGAPLVRPTPVVTVGAVPRLLKQPARAAQTLSATVGVSAADLRRDLHGAPPDAFVPLITLRRPDYQRVKPRLYPIPGLHFQAGTLPLAPTPTFGRAILGQVGPATVEALKAAGPAAAPSDDVGLSGLELVYQRRMAGTASGRVEIVDAAGHPTATLFQVRGHGGRSVRTTLDARLQAAAERALNGVTHPAALVAVQASTGQILAVADRPATSTFDRALDASYPPGSTFKVVSTDALLTHGFDPSSSVDCPPSITVDGKAFRNFEGEAKGAVTFTTDFAQSCNAAFVKLSQTLPRAAIPTAAKSVGFGARWTLPVAAYSGQAPPPADTVEQAADMIGQGRILASPLTMALVAAAVDGGTWHPPTLVTDPAQNAGAAKPQPLPAHVEATLHTLMRAVVTSGTGTAANVPGAPVYGKTGTAEFGPGNPPKTHAWFIGFRGDVAFAVIVEGGGVGGRVAAPIAARFLRGA